MEYDERTTVQESTENLERVYSKIMSWKEYAQTRHSLPYPYEIHGPSGDLLFFGASHENDPQHLQFIDLEKKLESWNPDIVYIEGRSSLNNPDTREEELAEMRTQYAGMTNRDAILMAGESGLAGKFALDRGIELKSPEPNPKQEMQNLIEKGFSKEHIFAKYLYMIIPQWHREHEEAMKEGVGHKSFDEYLERFRNRFEHETQWDGFDYSRDHLRQIGKELWGDDEINESDPEYYVPRIDPTPWPGTEKYQSPINDIAREGSLYRDRFLIASIFEDMKAGKKRPFVVFGASHAVMVQPALEALIEKKQ